MPSRSLSRARKSVVCGSVAVTVLGLAAISTATQASAATGSSVKPFTTATPTPSAGQRRSATRLNFAISGTANLSVDVATGNALFSDNLLTLAGVNDDLPIALAYNSSVWGSSASSAVTADTGSGWGITGFDQRLVSNSDGSVTYYGPSGLTGVFAASGTAFTAPTQFRATLKTVSGGGWTLTDHTSQNKLTFNSSGRLTASADKNGNSTAFDYTAAGAPLDIISTRANTTSRKLSITLNSGRISKLTQTDAVNNTRSVTLGYTSGGHLSSITDTAGGVTSFSNGGDTGQVLTITNPGNSSTTLAFSGSKVSSVSQSNAQAGAAGTSVTRLTYPSATQTLVADPTTDQSQAVSAVAHTTYALNSTTELVSSTTDPDGHARSKTYTSLGDVASSTPASGGATTFSYGSNSGESLTSTATAAGATDTATFTNTGASQYLPNSTSDDAGNSVKYTYDGAGNSLTTAQGTGPSASIAYNTDGTASSSKSPGGTVATTYTYDSTKDLTKITPPTGTSLGARSYTWDTFGRLHTATDGDGSTITYAYDDLDRITSVSYSDGTHTVAYTYNSIGKITRQVDASGTTTNTWDSLGKLLTTVNTAGGGTITYAYDKLGSLTSESDARGTTTYGYDAAHLLTSMTYPKSGATQTVQFANDANGRRTDTWLQSNATHTTWSAHTATTYDGSGRVTHVLSQQGPATGPTTVLDETSCFASGSVAPACSTSTTADRSKIQWTKNATSGETNTYTYDTNGRLTKLAVTGGSNPRTSTYTYDSAGNRLTAKVTGTNASTQTLTYNAGNQITSTGYTYDGAGNITAGAGLTSTFTAAGQLATSTSGGSTTTYTYAGTGQDELTKQITSGGDTYQYAYGRSDQNGEPVIEEITRVSGGTSASAYVAHDPSGQPVLLQTSTGTVSMYVYDNLSNPVGLLTDFNAVAYAYYYEPFGGQSVLQNSGGTGDPQNPYLFQAGLQDRSTGLVKFGGRWYNPATGSWIQQDNLNAPLDPSNANRYGFAAGDPINGSDPTGTDVGDYLDDITSDGLGGAAGGAAVGCIADVETGCAPGAAAGAVTGFIGGAVSGAVTGLSDLF